MIILVFHLFIVVSISGFQSLTTQKNEKLRLHITVQFNCILRNLLVLIFV